MTLTNIQKNDGSKGENRKLVGAKIVSGIFFFWLIWPRYPSWSFGAATWFGVVTLLASSFLYMREKIISLTTSATTDNKYARLLPLEKAPPQPSKDRLGEPNSRPPLGLPSNVSVGNIPDVIGLEARIARQTLLLNKYPRYRNIEIYPEGTTLTEDKQFYRLRMIVDEHNIVKRVHDMN